MMPTTWAVVPLVVILIVFLVVVRPTFALCRQAMRMGIYFEADIKATSLLRYKIRVHPQTPERDSRANNAHELNPSREIGKNHSDSREASRAERAVPWKGPLFLLS